VDNRKIKAAVVSVSDTRREEDDVSGGILVGLLVSAGADVVEKLIVPDDLTGLRETLYALTEREDVNLIVTTGGTGFAERDNTPEATLMVIEREAPGLAEAMRAATLKNTPFAMLSRGVCGIRNSTLIINLPGSPKGVKECFEVVRPVLQHALNLITGDNRH
jgi:molybdenum cofactor synthesis domain-containing protein